MKKQLTRLLFAAAVIGLALFHVGWAFGQNNASHLAILAASMKPGTFALLNEVDDGSGWSADLVDGLTPARKGVGSIFAYAQKAAYDPVTDSVIFSGGAHDGRTETIRYDIQANTWANEGPVSDGVPNGHSYDSNTIDPAARELYKSARLEPNTMARYNIDTHTWSTMSQPATIGFGAAEGSLEYFPDRDELLWVQNKKLGVWKKASNSWKGAGNVPELQWRSPIARYSTACKCVLIIGGANTDTAPTTFSHAIYRYDRNGSIARLKDTPPTIKIYVSRAVVATDPISGDLIVIQALLGRDINDFTGQYEFWKYSVAADTWSKLDETVVPQGWWAENYPFAVVATPLSKYGVILYMSAAGGRSRVYLYKNAQGEGVVYAPSAAVEATPANTPPSPPLSVSVPPARVVPAPPVAAVNSNSISRPVRVQATFAEKCAKPGVLSCLSFDSPEGVRSFPTPDTPLRYVWNGPSACDSAGLTKFPFTANRSANEATALAVAQNGTCHYPTIDSAIAHTGVGSLKIDFPSKSDAQAGGYFTLPFGGLGSSSYIGPGSPLGNELWFQWYQRFDPNMLNQDFGDKGLSGWKQAAIFGEPPGYSGSTNFGVVVINSYFRGVPQFYNHVPTSGGIQTNGVQDVAGCEYRGGGIASNPLYKEPPCARYKPNVWQEFTLRISVLGDTPRTPTSLIELYVDGKLVSQQKKAVIDWGQGGKGYGQFFLQPHQTDKNPAIAHPDGTVWYDDVVISSQPIPLRP